MTNSLNPDHALHFVGPDMGPDCLQKLSSGDISKLGSKVGVAFGMVK